VDSLASKRFGKLGELSEVGSRFSAHRCLALGRH
jgi:hypothetical protein